MYLMFALGVIAFLLALFLTPVVRDCFLRFGIMDQPDQHRKIHKTPIVRVGGIAIVLAYVSSFGLMLLFPFEYGAVVERALPSVWRLLPAIAVIFATGLIDDILGLKPNQKLIGQIVASCLAYTADVRISIAPEHALAIFWNLPLTIIWMVACTNAFNLIDGLDGLAAGVGLFATVTTLVAGLTHNNTGLALVTMPLVGALLGFLRYNFNPASIFLGDCGSLLIGFILSCCGILWGQKSATLLGMTAPLIALSIPLLEVVISVIRRFLRNQPIFMPDQGHMHHQLLRLGMTPRRAALLMYGAAGIVAALSLIQNVVFNSVGGLVVVLFCCAAWVGVQHLGYVEFGMARDMFLKGRFRIIIEGQTRLIALERELSASQNFDDWWRSLSQSAAEFGFSSARLCLNGVTIDQVSRESRDTPFWQIRIPVTSLDYVELHRPLDAQLHPLMTSAFVDIVSRAFRLLVENAHQSRGTSTKTAAVAAGR